MIRPRGVALAVVAFILLVLAGSTRVGWLLLFDAVLWGSLGISAVMPWLAIGRLHVRRRVASWEARDDAPGPMEGQPVEFEVTLRNSGLLPSMFTSVTYNCEGETVEPYKERLLLAWLGRQKTVSTTTAVRFDRRGLHQLPPVKVETTVPFGLFRRTKRVGDPARVVVLPRVYPIGRLDKLGSVGIADPRPLRARVGELITGSRNYVSGDSWQHIHWRNTARTVQPQIKDFENVNGRLRGDRLRRHPSPVRRRRRNGGRDTGRRERGRLRLPPE